MLEKIRIVMVETAHPGNIGSAARAMKTMGLTQLALVKPALFPCEQAAWMASGAKDVLEQATVYDTLQEAVADCHLVIGTSARNRRIPWPVVDVNQCAEVAIKAVEQSNQVAVVFGRESKGLSNEELHLCTSHLSIPSSDEYGVLNVAMAVQVVCYELRMRYLSQLGQQVGSDDQGEAKSGKKESKQYLMPVDWSTRWDEPLANSQELSYFNEHLEQVLIEIGFLHPHHPKQILTRLQRLFARARLDKSEMNMLRGILSSMQAYSKPTSSSD